MSEIAYPWKRFWYPRGGEISLADDGFLIDPDAENAGCFSSDAISFESISTTPCVALLGEPGIGKSTALRAEFEVLREALHGGDDEALWFDLRDYSSDDRLERKVFESPEVQRWRDSNHMLHVFFDSLDEALLRIDNITRVLLTNLERLPKQKLRLRIASRPADWQVTLEHGLIKMWGDDNVSVFEAAPLRRIDAITAARLSSIDPERFMQEVLERDVAPLANKPVTLKFLIGAFAKSGALPVSRVELYCQGCALLCEEPSLQRRDAPLARGRLGAGQRLAIATRIAAVTQISNRSAIWLGTDQGLESQDVALDSLIGGMEGQGAGQVTVDRQAIREALDTGLFSSRGLSRQGWRHQSYSEYLAAYYLNAHRVPVQRLRSFLFHPDGSGKVIPQLREVAAWLAGMNAHVFNLLVQSDPEVLLRSDMAVATHADRSKVARRLIEGFESGDVTRSIWDIRGYFARLNSPELVQIVQPCLTSRSVAAPARITAIEITRACRLNSLQQDLVSIALDDKDATLVRVHAASTIAEIGNSAARAGLRPLALQQLADDPQDDLKGYALIAVWPEYIGIQELFLTITPPKAENYFGAYRRFLDSSIAEHLQPEHMHIAIPWARERTGARDNSDPVGKLASNVLERAVEYVDCPAVRSLLATTLVVRRRAYMDCNRITERLRALGDVIRHSLAHEMFTAAASEKHGSLIVIDVCGLSQKDVPWLLSELKTADPHGIRCLIADIISRRLDSHDVDTFGAVLEAADIDEDLRAAVEHVAGVVYMGTRQAEEMKEYYVLSKQHQQPAPLPPSISAAEYVAETLASKTPGAFFRIYWWLHEHKNKSHKGAEPLPAWSEVDEGIRTALIESAREYLDTTPPAPAGCWWKEGRFSSGMIAGYHALRLLALKSPQSLGQLTDDNWNSWARIVVTYLPNGTDSAHLILLVKAYERAKETFLSTLSDVIDGEDARYQRALVASSIVGIWNEELASIFRSKIASGNLTVGGFVDVLGKLIEMGDSYAKERARSLATGSVPSEGEDRRKTVLTTAALLSHNPAEWSVMWPVFQANEKFGIEVLQVVASHREYTSFATEISENEVADICIWLSKLGLDQAREQNGDSGSVTAPFTLANWWNALIHFLTRKGTPEACQAIRRLTEALPQYAGLQHSLRQAEERTREATWLPLAIETVIQLSAFASSGRLVMSIHGIRTRGKWQKEVNSQLQENGFKHEILDYDFFGAMRFLIPSQRARKVDWFRGEYERRVKEFGTVPSVIAHSFGTYLVANAIEKYAELRFDRIILCGAIIRRDFDWDSLIRSGRVGAVLNEYGMKDIWAKIAEIFVVDAGASGAIGFDTSSSLIYQRRRPLFQHGDFFYPLNYAENWIPFLKGAEPSEYATEVKASTLARASPGLC